MLVPVPWQPEILVHADLLVKLERVQARLGRPPYLYGVNSGWRSYAQQRALWDAHQAGKGPVASNPDTGNRTHMRGVAADLRDTSQVMQTACIAVGLQRDPAEAWHWQLPTWRSYPIITELPRPEPAQRRRNMTTRFVQIGTGGKDFGVGAVCALAGDAGFPSPANWQEYTRTHADGSVNDRAAREFAVHGPAVPITKAEWERLKRDYTTGATAGGATPDQIAKAVNDDAARRMSS